MKAEDNQQNLILDDAVMEIANQLRLTKEADFEPILEIIGDEVEVDSIFIFNFMVKYKQIDEWTAMDYQPLFKDLSQAKIEELGWKFRKLVQDEEYIINNSSQLSKELIEEQVIIQSLDVSALVLVPIFDAEERLVGIIGAAKRQTPKFWSESELKLFNITAEMLGNHYELYKTEVEKRKLFNTIETAAVVLDSSWQIIAANDEFKKLSGYTEELPEDVEMMDFIHQDDVDKVRGYLQQKMNSSNLLLSEEEVRFITKDQRTKHVSISAGLIPETTEIIVSLLDITEKKEIKDEFRKNAELLYSSFEKANIGMTIINLDKEFIKANDAFCNMLGYSKEQMLQKTFIDITHPNDRERSINLWNQLIDGGERTVEFEKRYLHQDGYIVWADINLTLVRDENDDPLYFISQIENITEEKKTKQKLEYSHKQLEKTFNSMVDTLGSVISLRDPYTAGHQQRVAELAVEIGREMNLHSDMIEGIKVAGILHDIGKIKVPAEILSRPGEITDEEFQLIQQHCRHGYDILQEVEFDWPIAEVALQHHERIDGSGYPQGLSGEDILLEAKILAVADVVEAMSSHRPYRPSLGIDAAINEIKRIKASNIILE